MSGDSVRLGARKLPWPVAVTCIPPTHCRALSACCWSEREAPWPSRGVTSWPRGVEVCAGRALALEFTLALRGALRAPSSQPGGGRTERRSDAAGRGVSRPLGRGDPCRGRPWAKVVERVSRGPDGSRPLRQALHAAGLRAGARERGCTARCFWRRAAAAALERPSLPPRHGAAYRGGGGAVVGRPSDPQIPGEVLLALTTVCSSLLIFLSLAVESLFF